MLDCGWVSVDGLTLQQELFSSFVELLWFLEEIVTDLRYETAIISAFEFMTLNIAMLSRPFSEAKGTCMQVLQFVHQCAAQLGDAGESAEMALQLFLTAAYSASEHAKSELIAYEFFEQVTTCTQDTFRTSVPHDF